MILTIIFLIIGLVFVAMCELAYWVGRKTTRDAARADCVRFIRNFRECSRVHYYLMTDREKSEAITFTEVRHSWRAIESTADALEGVEEHLLWSEK